MTTELTKRRKPTEWMRDNSWWFSLIFGSGILFGIIKMYSDGIKESCANKLAEREMFWRSELDKNRQIAELSKDIAVSKAEKMASGRVEVLEEKLRITSSRLLNATESVALKLGRNTVFASDFIINSEEAAKLMKTGGELFSNGTLFSELKPPFWNIQKGVGVAQISSFVGEQTIKLGPEDESQYKMDPNWWPLFTIFTHEERGQWIIAAVGSIPKSQLSLLVEKVGGFEPAKASMMSGLPIGYLGAFLSTTFFVGEKSSISEVNAIAVKEDVYFISSVYNTPEGRIRTDFIVLDAGGAVFCAFISYYGYDMVSPAVLDAQDWFRGIRFVR